MERGWVVLAGSIHGTAVSLWENTGGGAPLSVLLVEQPLFTLPEMVPAPTEGLTATEVASQTLKRSTGPAATVSENN